MLNRLHAVFSLVPLVACAVMVQAQTLTVLHAFTYQPDGAYPAGRLFLDATGNLYGTTYVGGTSDLGAIYQVTSAGTESVLFSFIGGAEGNGPEAGLIHANGNFYGTASMGGVLLGTTFAFNSVHGLTTLASFGLQDGGGYPESAVIRDEQGNLYGTASGDNGGYGNGAVYQITSTGTLKLLYQFTGAADGLCPYSSLVRDSSGNLYGTTYRGGTFGYGTVYEVTSAGTESVLYSFTGGADGSNPVGELLRDASGDFYGTTTGGGTVYGTVFKLSSDGTETVLHTFNVTDGYYPATGLVRDQRGNLYGTTIFGGKYDKGTIYKVEKNGKESVLYSFTGQADGGSPDGALIRDKAGNLYGTTTSGGAFNSECLSGCGVVYKLTP